MNVALHGIDLILVIIYLLLTAGIGFWAGKGIKNMKDFSVAGKSYGSFVIFATISASFIGGGYCMGNAAKAYEVGLVYSFALLGFSVKEFFVALFIAPRMNKFPDAISVGDVIGKQFGKLAQCFTGIFAVLICAGILGAQVGGIGLLFEQFLGMPQWIGICVGIGIVIFYTAFGGMRAVVLTDVLQFIVLTVGVPLILILAVLHAGGLGKIVESVPPNLLAPLGGSEFPWIQFISLFFVFMLGETLVPPYFQRLLIAKDDRSRKMGTLYSGIYSIPFFLIAGALGVVAFAVDPNLEASQAMPYLINTVMPIGAKGLVIAGIIAVLMSSADSFLNAAAVSLVNDVINPFARLSDRQELRLGRWATILTGAIAVVFAFSGKGLLDILVLSYDFWSPMILTPLVAVIFGIKSSRRAFFSSAAAGCSGVFLWNRYCSETGFSGMLAGIIVNLAIFSIITAIDKRKEVLA